MGKSIGGMKSFSAGLYIFFINRQERKGVLCRMFTGCILSSLCTSLGAIPALFLIHMTHRGKDIILAYTAGIMVAASTYGLIPSALKLSNMLVLSAGILSGTAALTILEKYVPHVKMEHTPFRSSYRDQKMLFLIAMVLHNFPEGLSVGVSCASTYSDLGLMVSFAIGLQNVPEGFLVALFLLSNAVSRTSAFFITTITGLLELLSCWVGYQFAGNVTKIVPYSLAFAAGAMLFVVYKELIPESHGDGNERSSTFSFIIGLLTMIGLTHWLK